MATDRYHETANALYMSHVTYIINDGTAENGAKIECTFDMANIIKNMMSDCIQYNKDRGYDATAMKYESMRSQMWEQESLNGFDDIFDELAALRETRNEEDETQD